MTDLTLPCTPAVCPLAMVAVVVDPETLHPLPDEVLSVAFVRSLGFSLVLRVGTDWKT